MKPELVLCCRTCEVTKPESEFRLRKSKSTGQHYRGKVCRACHQAKGLEWRQKNPDLVRKYNEKQRAKDPAKVKRDALEAHFRRKFSMTMQDRDQMLVLQGGRCLICGTDKPSGKGWCVDHHHATGRIRGILCAPCNSFIGLAKEDVSVLQQAITYLEEK